MDATRLIIFNFLLQLVVANIINAVPYTAIVVADTMDNAVAECDSKKLQLSLPRNQEDNENLLREMKSNNLSKAWLGVRESDSPWKWISDGSVVENQGCYQDLAYLGAKGGELSEYHEIKNAQDFTNFKALCKAECKTRGYKYAALRLTGDTIDNQREKQCGCGNSFGTVGTANLHSCPKECFLEKNEICGNSYYILVFATEGSPSLRYDDTSGGPYATCAAMRHFYKPEYGLSFYWSRMTPCSTFRNFLCDVPKGNRMCQYSYPIDRCIIAIYSKKSWYGARQICLELGGDLPKIRTHQEAENIRVAFRRSSWLADDTEGFWIGLTKSSWTTPDSSPIAYYNWSIGFPSRKEHRCAVMDSNGEWMDEDCSSKHSFICSAKPDCAKNEACTENTNNVSSKNIAIIVIVVLVCLVIVAVIFAVIHNCCIKCTICVNGEPERTIIKNRQVYRIKKDSKNKSFNGQVGYNRDAHRENTNSIDSGSLTQSVYTMNQNEAFPIQIQARSLSYSEADTLDKGAMSCEMANDDRRLKCIVKQSTVVVEEPIHARAKGGK